MKVIYIFLLLVLLSCAQLPSFAISVNGSLTSAAWARENRLENAEESETNLLLYEYLNLHAIGVGSPRLTAHFSGRLGWDRFASFGDSYTARLYQGYLDWKLSNKSSLRLGRQFLPNNIGFWQINGIQLESRRSGFISPSFYAGMSVLPWTIEGDNEPILGIELSSKRIKSIRSKLSFFTIFNRDGGDQGVLGVRGVDKAIVGIQVDRFGGDIIDLLETPHNRLTISGSGNLDVLAKQIINSSLFASVRVISDGQLYLGYQQEVSLFPADSIFAVFASEPYRQLTVGMDYGVKSFLDLQSQYARQFFDTDSIDRYSIGFTFKNQREPLLSLRLERLNDIDTHYWRIYSHIGKQLGERLEIGLNNYYNNYKLTRSPKAEDAYSFQLKAGYRLNRNLNAFIRLEDNINPDYKYNIRALGYLRMNFGFTK